MDRGRCYLAGPIQGCTDDEAKSWRAEARELLAYVLDPMDRDYRGIEDANVSAIVEGDKRDISDCGVVLAFCPKPSVGTSMEIHYAWQRGIPTVVVVPEGSPVSPWLRYHATAVVSTISEGAALIRGGKPLD